MTGREEREWGDKSYTSAARVILSVMAWVMGLYSSASMKY